MKFQVFTWRRHIVIHSFPLLVCQSFGEAQSVHCVKWMWLSLQNVQIHSNTKYEPSWCWRCVHRFLISWRQVENRKLYFLPWSLALHFNEDKFSTTFCSFHTFFSSRRTFSIVDCGFQHLMVQQQWFSKEILNCRSEKNVLCQQKKKIELFFFRWNRGAQHYCSAVCALFWCTEAEIPQRNVHWILT